MTDVLFRLPHPPYVYRGSVLEDIDHGYKGWDAGKAGHSIGKVLHDNGVPLESLVAEGLGRPRTARDTYRIRGMDAKTAERVLMAFEKLDSQLPTFCFSFQIAPDITPPPAGSSFHAKP